MARKTPVVYDTRLTWFDPDRQHDVGLCDIVKDWSIWQEFLETESVFRYVGIDGTNCSFRKEVRPHFGNKDDWRPVWYGHKRMDNKLRRQYVGKSENCTREKLKSVAFELSQRKII